MVRKAYTHEQILNKLAETEVLISQRVATQKASRQIRVTEQTY